MRKAFSTLTLFICALALTFTSCKKDEFKSNDDLYKAIASEEATVTLSKAGFTTNSTGLIKASEANYYKAGTMEYIVDGSTEATFSFKTGGQGSLNKGGAISNKTLKSKSGKTSYTKVIVSPIVKVTGCKYIVQGIVEYYDKNNTLLATIDFGNGTCDEWAVKSFPNNSKPDYTFSQDDWFKK